MADLARIHVAGRCNVLCSGDVHGEVLYGDGLRDIPRWMESAYGPVEVVEVLPAPEAPPLEGYPDLVARVWRMRPCASA